LLDQAVPATWRSLAAARFKADFPSGNAPSTRVRRRMLVDASQTGQCQNSSSVHLNRYLIAVTSRTFRVPN
jgi:hypothetical protein